MKMLLVAHNGAECESLTAFAQAGNAEFDVLCLSGDAPTDLGAGKVMQATGTIPPADALAQQIAGLGREYAVVVTTATMAGKDWSARVAGLLDRPMVSDIMSVQSERKFTRPMFAGNVIADVEVSVDNFVATIRATSFSKPNRGGSSSVESIALAAEDNTKRLGASKSEGGRPDLAQARVVVSGGRPLKDAETFEKLIGGLADALQGAAGATRAAVDSGIAPNELQVGQTGKIVAPDLYIAAGVSGSTQHMAGMKDSKTIVAINTDPDAPIFEIADYGLMQDLFVAIPEMLEKLRSK